MFDLYNEDCPCYEDGTCSIYKHGCDEDYCPFAFWLEKFKSYEEIDELKTK